MKGYMKVRYRFKQLPLKRVYMILLLVLAVISILAVLTLTGKIRPNLLLTKTYSINGVDVSAHQGEIDWEKLAAQNIQFAYIKATEGSSHTDRYFAQNRTGAEQAGIRAGAYHFFSFDSSGNTQAAHFIETVEAWPGMLPPAVDVEFYGDKYQNPPDREDVKRELQIMLDALEEAYGQKPVIYATQKSYKFYISGAFDDYDLWIRNVYTPPLLPGGQKWVFWQYTDKARLEGYQGSETFIDRNVFRGTAEEFKKYGVSP